MKKPLRQVFKVARERAGLTREQLSEHYGIPIRTVQSWEWGQREPAEYVINSLLRCMSVDFNIPIADVKEDIGDSGDYRLSHMDNSPLTKHEQDYVYHERKAGNLTHRGMSADRFYLLYKCSNGFVFRVSKK